MDFNSVVETLNQLLARIQPDVINSSWIRKHAPQCYRFIRQNLRREFGGIDWDRLTYALDWKFQKRWTPRRTTKSRLQYEDHAEVATILKKYQDKMYVLSPLRINMTDEPEILLGSASCGLLNPEIYWLGKS